MGKTVSLSALLILILAVTTNTILATDSSDGCDSGKTLCKSTGECQTTCEEDEAINNRRRRNAGQNSASSYSTATESISPTLTECVTYGTESTLSYSEMTISNTGYTVSVTGSTGWAPSVTSSIRCTFPPTESYPSTTASMTTVQTSDSITPSSSGMSGSSSAMLSSSYMQQSTVSMSSSSYMSSSTSSMPSSSYMSSSTSSMPSSSYMSSSTSSMPSSSSMPATTATMSTSSRTFPASSSAISPTPASTATISATTTGSTAALAPSTGSTSTSAASTRGVNSSVVSTAGSTSSIIATTTQPFMTKNQEFQFKIQGTSVSDFVGNSSMEEAKDAVTTTVSNELNINKTRIEHLTLKDGSVIVTFQITPASSSSEPTISEVDTLLRNLILSGNLTLTNPNGEVFAVDRSYFVSRVVDADGDDERRRDLVPVIVGSVVGVFCLALIFIVIVVIILKKKKPTKHNSFVSPSSSNGRRSQSPYGNGTNDSLLPDKPGIDKPYNAGTQQPVPETAPGTSSRPGSESQRTDV